MPRVQYVPNVTATSLVFSDCALNSHVPVGARLQLGKSTAFVKVGSHHGHTYFELRLDVPPGTTLRFEDDRLELRTSGAPGLNSARFPSISLVDNPIVNNYSTLDAVRNQQLPTLSPMIGGEVAVGSARSSRHFWLATYVDVLDAPQFVARLPALVEDGAAVHRLQVTFRAQTVVAVAVINC